MPTLHRPFLLSAFLLLTILALAIGSIYLIKPPQALPADAPLDKFSAGRAMEYVHKVAHEPHAMGTPAHERVRQYLLTQMQQLRLNPQVQTTTIVKQEIGVASAGYVQNILGRLKGAGTGKAVLLMAHYDSKPNTPGAGDDAAGVASLLETARALQETNSLQNDIIFLLTDGEEYGLFGAHAFKQHPWINNVGLVINVEARGNKGPSFTFEVSPENGWLMEEFAKAAPYPIAGSVMYEVYKRMPNDTDFSVMREAGLSGVNSALINGFANYHSMTDTPENLDRNSLQHHGSNMLALARHFGNISLENTKAKDRVFFNPIGTWLVQFPVGNNILWVSILTLLLVVTWQLGVKRNVFKTGQVVAGAFLYLLMLAIVSGLFFPVNGLVLEAMPYFTPGGGTYNTDYFFVAYLLLALGLYLVFAWLITYWLKPLSFTFGAFLLWFVLLSIILFAVPTATYILLFPLLFGLAGLLLVLKLRLYENTGSWSYGILLLISAVPGLFMLAPIVYLLFVVFDLNFPVAMVLLLGLLIGLLVPILTLVENTFRFKKIPLLPVILLAVGTGILFWAINLEEPDLQQPEQSALSYFLNADTREAVWASQDKTPDYWTSSILQKNTSEGTLSKIYPYAGRIYLKSEAKPIGLEAPEADVLADSLVADTRYLKLKISSLRQAAHLELVLMPEPPQSINAIKLNDVSVAVEPINVAGEEMIFIRLYGLPESKEATLELELNKGSKLNLFVYDQTIGLPQQLLKTPRPADVIPAKNLNSNLTVVRKTYRF